MNIHPFNLRQPADFWPKFLISPTFGPNKLEFELDKKFSGGGELSVVAMADPVATIQGEVRNDALVNLEAVLFLSREPLSAQRLAQLAVLPEGTKIRILLQNLNEQYDRRQSAFRIMEVAGGFQLRTRPEFAPWLVRMQEVPVTVRLSNPVIETLVVIAYRQPVPRAEIERLRGVQCGELIRQLLDRDLVKIVGHSEELGRPFLYGTTKNFLQVFGLGNLNDLPNRESFANVSTPSIKSKTSETVPEISKIPETPDFDDSEHNLP
jgi:segregation and condensation protein B